MNFQRDLPRIDLRFAKLCMELDCNTVFDSAMFRNCPTCGSIEFYPLESWLNRERSEKASVVIGNVSVDRAVHVGAMPRPLWLERLGAWSWRALVIIGVLVVLLQFVLVVPLYQTDVTSADLVRPNSGGLGG